LIRSAAGLFLLISCAVRMSGADDPTLAQVRRLFEGENWRQIVTVVRPIPAPSAELDYYYGTALARLGFWEDADRAFTAGARLQPWDKRFPQELAGVAFKQKNYPRAVRHLRRALALDPNDPYTSDFLAATFLLQGNLEAALKYWNRIAKPRVERVRAEPVPRLRPELLDRALAFAPASTLHLPDLLTSQARLRGLGVFPTFHFDLQAREDGAFDMVLLNRERTGWGSSTLETLLLAFRGLPFQTVHGEVFNLKREAMNFTSLFRWDAEKRRGFASFSAPLGGNPKWRYGLQADLRSENWNILDSVSAATPLLGSFNLRREALDFQLASFESGRWTWSLGVEASHRDFRSVIPGPALTPSLLAKGYQLKQMACLDTVLLRMPERRFSVEGGVSTQAGHIWSQPGHEFFKLQGYGRWHWFPRPAGDDYQMQQQVRLGKTFGTAPFDELFMLGLEHDNDLEMRAHLGTRHGRKGSAPLGSTYFLSNWEADKNVFQNGLFNVKLGPFVDSGRITDPAPGLGSHKWLWDVGAQVKARAFGVGLAFSYGKDLRSGNNAFYVTMLP
jgi:hypothetical protein